MITSIIVFVAVLSVLILVHELGHFFVAKRSGVWVEEFGFGLPPRVIGKKVGETIYSINLLPFGGFVRLHGENSDEALSDPKRAFLNQNKKKKVAIIVAGVIMNFFLAITAFSISYSFSGIPRQTENVKVVEVAEGSPAADAGLKEGDVVKEIEGKEVKTTEDFINIIEEVKGETVNVVLLREGQELTLPTNLREDPPQGEGAMGVVISSVETYFPPLWQRPFYGVYYGVRDAFYWGEVIIVSFVGMIANLFRGVVPKDVAGPVGIYALTSQAAQFGILALINFVGILSINLAVLNILPFPALDGGRLFFIIIEAIFGKKVLPKVEAITHTVGMAILLLLILAITFQDVRRLIMAGSVSGFIDSLMQSQQP